jgi:hypothetical protein
MVVRSILDVDEKCGQLLNDGQVVNMVVGVVAQMICHVGERDSLVATRCPQSLDAVGHDQVVTRADLGKTGKDRSCLETVPTSRTRSSTKR